MNPESGDIDLMAHRHPNHCGQEVSDAGGAMIKQTYYMSHQITQ